MIRDVHLVRHNFPEISRKCIRKDICSRTHQATYAQLLETTQHDKGFEDELAEAHSKRVME